MIENETDRKIPMNISQIEQLLDFLERHKDDSREDLRTHLMFSFNAPRLRDMMYFRGERERYLRREVADEFLNGKEVNQEELREAVYYMCCALSQAGDAIWAARKREEQKRHLPPRIPTRKIRGVR